MHPSRIAAMSVLVFVLSGAAGADPLGESAVPPPLRGWIPWVLHDADERACPSLHNAGSPRQCLWPGRLRLELSAHGGRFTLRVAAFRVSHMPLPGDPSFWPQALKVDGKPAPVTAHEGLPVVTLAPGAHTLSGGFVWDAMPENLRVPPAIGLIDLEVDGRSIATPRMDEQGRLWLQAAGDAVASGSRFDVHVERLLTDDIPFQVTTHFALTASGRNQEIVLPQAVLPGFLPSTLSSPLPARLEGNGKLRIQVRAGRWEVYVTSRQSAPIKALTLPQLKEASSREEIWAFAPQTRLRVVNVEGGTPVDAQQTQMPAEWKRYPAYRMRPGEELRFNEVKRGDPQPAPDALQLARTVWLDFDGRGYSIQDRITGTLSRSWRLEMAAPVVLGRVAVDGEDQFITRVGNDAGIEVRHGHASILADSRIDAPSRELAATGWTSDFQSLSMQLNVPPGWRLLMASGVDRAYGSWLSQWNNLLDFFIVLVIALACGKLWGWRWGALALAALALSYHEPGAPRWAWIIALIAVALVRVVTADKVSGGLKLVRRAALAMLVVLLIPFFVQQVRQTLYPVLEYAASAPLMMQAAPVGRMAIPEPPAAPAAAPAEHELKMEDSADNRQPDSGGAVARSDMPARKSKANRDHYGASQSAELDRIDPKAMIQTGPGLPAWRWRSYQLSWSGPVQHTQQIGLWLISPGMNAFVTVLRLLLLALLFLCIAEIRWRIPRLPARGATSALVLLAVLIIAAPQIAHAEATPDAELLQELKQKLLLPPECLPDCAEVARMRVSADSDVLRLQLEVHAAESVAVPLPAAARQWLPRDVLIDGKPAAALMRDAQGTLWVAVPRGVHDVLLQGSLHGLDAVQLALPLRPRRVETVTSAWRIDGVREHGIAENNLQLTRRQRNGKSDLAEGDLPPLVRVERTLVLGLQWQVLTRVTRLSPPDAPTVVEIPLLPGESITSAEPRAENGRAIVSMGPQTGELAWESVLKEAPEIKLTAAQSAGFIEVWRLNAGAQWRVSAAGIAPVQHQEADRWLPQWQPWPGESITLQISKPEGTPGQTVTMDASNLVVRPGMRITDAALSLRMRSSRGGQQMLTLPAAAVLQRVTINGALQPLRLEGAALRLPLMPGTQNVEIAWQQPQGIAWRYTVPAVDAGAASVNARTEIYVPEDRWLLLAGGPMMGPAILFWGVVLVIALVAFALGRIPASPLKPWQWLLLGLGLTQASMIGAAAIVGWFFAFAMRARFAHRVGEHKWRFDLMQVGLVLLTIAAGASLYFAVSTGLLGTPDMQVAGNGSTYDHLSWYQDRAGRALPAPWIVSVPMLVYRLLMLAWALWLAYSLLAWVRWAWHAFSEQGLWRKLNLRPQRSAAEQA